MKVIFSRDEYRPIGAVPCVPWDDPALLRMLRERFLFQPRRIKELIIDENGIYAHVDQGPGD